MAPGNRKETLMAAPMNADSLSSQEIEKYSRQLIISGWSSELQLRLRRQQVLLPGNLPSAALYLAAAGIGKIALYQTVGEFPDLKAQLLGLNPHIELTYRPPESAPDCTIAVLYPEEALSPQIAFLPLLTLDFRRQPQTACFTETDGSTSTPIELEEARNPSVSQSLLLGTMAAGLVIDYFSRHHDSGR